MFYGFTKTHVSFEINTKRPLHNSDITIMNTCMASSFVVFISCLVNKILLKFYYSPHSYSQQQCHILKASLRTQNEWNSRLLSFSSPLVWPIKMIFKIFYGFYVFVWELFALVISLSPTNRKTHSGKILTENSIWNWKETENN